MPVAVANINDVEHVDLKTLPGAFVKLRKLTYGQTLQRQSMMTMRMVRDVESKQKGQVKNEFNLGNVEVTAFEFTHCIVDHNLEDEGGRKLNLGNPSDFQRLDPRVGQEIDNLITKRNSFTEEDEAAGEASEGASEQ